MSDGMIDIGLYTCYIFTVIAVLLVTGFFFYFIFKDLAKAKTSMIGFAFLGAIFGISYLFSSGEVTPLYEKFYIGSRDSRLIGASLISLYILGGISVLAAIYVEIARFFK
jgi:hypothetical protein